MNTPVAACTLLLAASAAGCGASLLRTRGRATGIALEAFGAALLGSLVLWGRWHAGGVALLVLAWAMCLPAALLAYPQVQWRHPVGFATWVAVLAAGALVTMGGGTEATILPGSVVIAVALIGHHLWRYERATEADRELLLWASLAVVACGMLYGHSVFLFDQTSARVIGLVLFALVPPVLAVAIRRPTFVDVRGLIVEAVVFEVALVVYIAVLDGTAAAFELAGADQPSTGRLAVLAAITAVAFHPLRVRLRNVIDELLFGGRPDPLDAAMKVADRIGDDPVLALTAMREAMVLPYASLWANGRELASSGTPVSHTRRLTLSLGGDSVGEIVVGLRRGDLRLPAADERVLRIVGPLLAQTLRARSLVAELRASRGHALSAIEEERRRLRRDLHDGLGPTLSGIAFTADAARNSLDDPDAADVLLRTLRANAASAIAEIRQLVYAMRPPALDELGLVGALRRWVVQSRTADGRPLAVTVRAPGHLGELPAAVEVAAYRIAVEALINAARHSGSDRVDVDIVADESSLTIDVCDRGTTEQRWRPGIGLTSMHERAAEIGGAVTAGPTPTGGRVTAVLPNW